MLTSVRVFQCLGCGETISTGSPNCRFCNAPVNFDDAERAAEIGERANSALSDAALLRHSVQGLFGLYGVGAIVWVFALRSGLQSGHGTTLAYAWESLEVILAAGAFILLPFLCVVGVLLVRWPRRYAALDTAHGTGAEALAAYRSGWRLWGALVACYLVCNVVPALLLMWDR